MSLRQPVTFGQVLTERLDQLGRISRGEPQPRGVPTGFALWDRNGGLKRKVIHLIAGDAGEGKSFVKSTIQEAAAREGLRVDVFDLEDPAEETADRALAKHSHVKVQDIQGKVTPGQVRKLATAIEGKGGGGGAGWAERINYYDDLDSAQEMVDILDETDAELVVLDYLQLVPEGTDGLESTLRNLARAAQRWAKRVGKVGPNGKPLGGAFLALSQVKSRVSERGMAWYMKNSAKGYPEAVRGYRPGPGKADIAWCGAWGERAKSVTYLYREGRWGRHHGYDVDDNVLQLLQGKSSFGREGSINVGFDPAYGRLYDL